MNAILFLLLTIFSITTYGEDLVVTLTVADEREDGSALDIADIKEHVVYIIDKNSPNSRIVTIPCCELTTTFKDVTSGDWVGFALTIDKDGLISDVSSNLDINLDPKPGAPQNLVYEIQRKTVEEIIKTTEETIRVE